MVPTLTTSGMGNSRSLLSERDRYEGGDGAGWGKETEATRMMITIILVQSRGQCKLMTLSSFAGGDILSIIIGLRL